MITFLIILSTLLLISTVVLTYLLTVSYKKVAAAVKYAEWYAGFIFILIQKVKDVKMELDIVDHRGSFKADDEVGYTFEAIQSIINELDEFIKANLQETNG